MKTIVYYFLAVWLFLAPPVALSKTDMELERLSFEIAAQLNFLESINPIDSVHFESLANIDKQALSDMLNEMLTAQPDNKEALGLMALYQWKLVHTPQSLEEARKYFTRAIEEKKEGKEMLFGQFSSTKAYQGNYAHFLEVIDKDIVQAKKLYEETHNASGLPPIPAHRYANLLKKSGTEPRKIISVYSKSSRSSLKNKQVSFHFIDYLDSVSEENKADAILLQDLRVQPNNLSFTFQLSNRMVNRKKFNIAEFLYKKMLSQEPDNPSVLANYALFMQIERQDIAAAKSLFEKMVDSVNEKSDLPYATRSNILGSYAFFLRKYKQTSTKFKTAWTKAIEENGLSGSDLEWQQSLKDAWLKELPDDFKKVEPAPPLKPATWVLTDNVGGQAISATLYAQPEGDVKPSLYSTYLYFFCGDDNKIGAALSISWSHSRLNNHLSLAFDQDEKTDYEKVSFSMRGGVALGELEKDKYSLESFLKHKTFTAKRDFVVEQFNLEDIEKNLSDLKKNCQ